MAVTQDEIEVGKFNIDLPPIAEKEMDLLQELDLGNPELHSPDTTGTEDMSCNNTMLIDNYGVTQLMFFVNPDATGWADLADKQINGDFPEGEKPTGSVYINNHSGTGTSEWQIQRWFIRNFQIGPFDTKQSQTPLQIRLTLRPEKIVNAG